MWTSFCYFKSETEIVKLSSTVLHSLNDQYDLCVRFSYSQSRTIYFTFKPHWRKIIHDYNNKNTKWNVLKMLSVYLVPCFRFQIKTPQIIKCWLFSSTATKDKYFI